MLEAEAYSERSQTSKTVFFCENSLRAVKYFFKSFILDVLLGSEQVSEKLSLKKQFQKIILIIMV